MLTVNCLYIHLLVIICMYLFIYLFKCSLYLSVNVFSAKVVIEDAVFTSPIGDGTVIILGYRSHAKVQLFAGQREYFHF